MTKTIDSRTLGDYFINFFWWNKKFPLNSKAEINTKIKTIVYELEKVNLNFPDKRMFSYLCEQSKSKEGSVRELNKYTRYILNFPRLKGFFLENFLGYKRI